MYIKDWDPPPIIQTLRQQREVEEVPRVFPWHSKRKRPDAVGDLFHAPLDSLSTAAAIYKRRRCTVTLTNLVTMTPREHRLANSRRARML